MLACHLLALHVYASSFLGSEVLFVLQGFVCVSSVAGRCATPGCHMYSLSCDAKQGSVNTIQLWWYFHSALVQLQVRV